MHQGPDTRIIAVAILSPAQVIPNGLEVIQCLPNKWRWVLQLDSWKETAPVKGIAHSKISYHSARNFAAFGGETLITTKGYYTATPLYLSLRWNRFVLLSKTKVYSSPHPQARIKSEYLRITLSAHRFISLRAFSLFEKFWSSETLHKKQF